VNTLRPALFALFAVALFGASTACSRGQDPATPGPLDRVATLHDASTWMYQLQGLEEPAQVTALAESDYDLLVVEPGNTLRDGPADAGQLAQELHAQPNRLVLAYIDIGEAEDYRSYWQDAWQAPTPEQPGSPPFLITVDPDGWSGSYPVAYWDDRWRDIWLGAAGEVANLARLGFDGVYLDWVEAYDDPAVRAAAEDAGVDPEAAMIDFVAAIRAAGRAVTPDFLVVAQNAPYLIDADPDRYAASIDALAAEDTWFSGEGGVDWDDPGAGRCTQRVRRRLLHRRAAGSVRQVPRAWSSGVHRRLLPPRRQRELRLPASC
jgi:cysteinyl-tRNA synthetase